MIFKVCLYSREKSAVPAFVGYLSETAVKTMDESFASGDRFFLLSPDEIPNGINIAEGDIIHLVTPTGLRVVKVVRVCEDGDGVSVVPAVSN